MASESETNPVEPEPEPKPGSEPEPKPEPIYTQADLDRLLQERLDTAARDAETKAVRERKRAAETQAEEQGEWQKLAEARAAELADRETALGQVQAEVRQARLAHAVELAAYDLDFEDPDDALKLADLAHVKFDEAGRPNKDQIGQALRALAKAKPHLLVKSAGAFAGSPSPRGRTAPKPAITPTQPPRSLVR